MEGHSSGNPVPWDIEAGADAREYFSMIHVKKGDYAHWAVRIDRASRRVTHVSSGPLIKARDYRNEVLHASALCGCLGSTSRRVSGPPVKHLAAPCMDMRPPPSRPADADSGDAVQGAGASHSPTAVHGDSCRRAVPSPQALAGVKAAVAFCRASCRRRWW